METLLVNLPLVLLLLVCPLSMLFMHRGGVHQSHDPSEHAHRHEPER
jgi:hypothetical protein